jgi:sulfur-oxidizing protein SoxX
VPESRSRSSIWWWLAAGAVALTAVRAAAEPPVPYEVVGLGIPRPLTDEPGNPERGRLIVRDARNASCLICHAMPIPEEPNHGNIGPPLAGIGSRQTEAQLRLRLVDARLINPATVMPAYYSIAGFVSVQQQYAGQTIYSAQDIEDVVAYLLTLTE